MIVISESDAQTRMWKDPLVEIHVEEFRRFAQGLEKVLAEPEANRSARIEKLTEHLCEMSRDLIFRAHRVTPGQLDLMIGRLREAITRFQETDVLPHLTGPAKNYLKHLDSRVTMLEARRRSAA